MAASELITLTLRFGNPSLALRADAERTLLCCHGRSTKLSAWQDQVRTLPANSRSAVFLVPDQFDGDDWGESALHDCMNATALF